MFTSNCRCNCISMEQKLIELLQGANYCKKAKHTVALVEEHPELMKPLIGYFFSNDVRLCQSASWPIGILGVKHPKLIRPYLKKLVTELNTPKNLPTLNRNILRIFQDVEIPTNLKSTLLDKCFIIINQPKQPVAVIAFAITVASYICKDYPELQSELKINLNDLMDKPQSPAVMYRLKAALNKI